MPSAVSYSPTRKGSGITKFTNCRLVKGDKFVNEDLWISSRSGKILQSQQVFYDHQTSPDRIVDLGGRILAPGFMDIQMNGAYGFDFSQEPQDLTSYAKGVIRLNKNLIKTGVTSYLPTVTSQRGTVYPKVIPFLAPSGARRDAFDGSESLGAHLEGPFISSSKNGIHKQTVLRDAPNGFADLEACYGEENLASPSPVKLMTLAPELPGALANIPELTKRGITVSIGHSEATYEQACAAITAGATSITHLFNAMRPLHHRNPGIFGLLGTTSPSFTKPYFGIIADGIHLHPTSISIAWNANPDGFILVTDAMSLVGLEDGTYEWTNGSTITKKGYMLSLDGDESKIAGSSITLVECVSNFLNWTNANVAEAIRAVTATPAKLLGLDGVKGSVEPNADADLVVLDEVVESSGVKKLNIEQVWKFGKLVHAADEKLMTEMNGLPAF